FELGCSWVLVFHVFFHAPATTEIYTLSLHDALPISVNGTRLTASPGKAESLEARRVPRAIPPSTSRRDVRKVRSPFTKCCAKLRSEEHTSELQSLAYLVCRLLLEKKKNFARQAHSTQ